MTLAQVQPDGATLRDHLEAARRMRGAPPGMLVELTAVPCPAPLRYLWQAFLELSDARGSAGFGPAPLSWQEIEAWSRLKRRPLSAWQVDVFKRLDRLFLTHQAKQLQPKNKGG